MELPEEATPVSLEKAVDFAARAYELRDRVSDRERFYIEARYHDSVTGDLDQSAKVYETWTQTYPRDYVPWNNLGVIVAGGELGRLFADLGAEVIKIESPTYPDGLRQSPPGKKRRRPPPV